MKKLAERMKKLITCNTVELKKYKELEELTGITTATWRSWWNRGGAPSGEMIEAVSRIWPEYAFWLVTGISDPGHGHDLPNPTRPFRRRTAARDLFLKEIEAQKWREENQWTGEEDAQYHAIMDAHSKGSPGPYTAPHVDTQIKQRIEHWHFLLGEISELERIRDAQEHSLKEFENDEPLPF